MGFLSVRPLASFIFLFLLVPLTVEANVCISCHRDLGGKLAEAVTLWEQSIHRQMENSCEGCHGGDPNDPAEAMSAASGFVGTPKQQQITNFCGKCHVGVKENYEKSVHHITALAGNGPTCITCHHSHDVQRASFGLIEESLCAQCHSFENGQKMKKAFETAELSLQGFKKEIDYLKNRGMPTQRMEENFFALRNSLHQMTHTLDLTEIEQTTGNVLEDLRAMKGEARTLRAKIYRRWGAGGVVALFLIGVIYCLIRLEKTLEEKT